MSKLLGMRSSPFLRERLHLFHQKSLSKRERERLGPGTTEIKVITPEKIVPYKCCLPSSDISMKRDFDTDVPLTNAVTHFQLLFVTII